MSGSARTILAGSSQAASDTTTSKVFCMATVSHKKLILIVVTWYSGTTGLPMNNPERSDRGAGVFTSRTAFTAMTLFSTHATIYASSAQFRGCKNSDNSASRVPGAGCQSYSQRTTG